MRLLFLLSVLQGASCLPHGAEDNVRGNSKVERAIAGHYENPIIRLYDVTDFATPTAEAPVYAYTPPAKSNSPVVLPSTPSLRLPQVAQGAPVEQSVGTVVSPISLQRTTTWTLSTQAAPVSSSSVSTTSPSTVTLQRITTAALPASDGASAAGSSIKSSSTTVTAAVIPAAVPLVNSPLSIESTTSSTSSVSAVAPVSSSTLSTSQFEASIIPSTSVFVASLVTSASTSASVASSSSVESSTTSSSVASTPSSSVATFTRPTSPSRMTTRIPAARLTQFPVPVDSTSGSFRGPIFEQSSAIAQHSGNFFNSAGAWTTSCETPLSNLPTIPAPGTSPSPSSLTRVQVYPSPQIPSNDATDGFPLSPTGISKVTVPVTRTRIETRLRTRTTTLRIQGTETVITSVFQAQAPVTIVESTTVSAPPVTVIQPTTLNAPPKTVTIKTTLTVSETQRVTVLVTPTSTGTVITSLNTVGQNTQAPIRTVSVATSGTISPITAGPSVIDFSTAAAQATSAMSADIFVPIALNAPPAQISTRADHPVPRTGIIGSKPFQTNKFYSNFYLGNRTQGTWTHPYSVAWAGGTGAVASWGLAVSHVNRTQTIYGPGSPPRYFVNPIAIQSMIMSAREIETGSQLTMDSLRAFSVDINLTRPGSQTPVITFPIVQGMGFVTGVYSNATPLLQSGVFFKTIVFGGAVAGSSTVRYTVTLMDNTIWLVYLTPSAGTTVPTLTLLNNSKIVGSRAFAGTIQVAKNPNGAASQAIYDGSAGVYPLRGAVHASVSQNTGTYSLSWVKSGILERQLLMFALPHHVQSFRGTQPRTALQLITTTKGMSTAVVGDSWQMVENNLPYDMGFAPWSPTLRSQTKLPTNAQTLISRVAATELNEDMNAQTNLNSMYFSGKGLAKFAFTVFAANNLAHNTGAASAGLVKLKQAFARFVSNTQQFPLVYDSAWGGAVSSSSYITGNSGDDFGNTYYNDHHFHYGYFVYTAAVIGFMDPNWLSQGTNKQWVNMLVRDYANPASNDTYFPFSRMFDWFHGHSWAHGLYESADGKDQESSSEDTFASYALKMWGRTIGDANMEARGNLMLSIQARSLQNYYLMQSNNQVQPPSFVPNKVAGILFENKCDHTTYFGTRPEYIEGIHMIPLNPASTLIRNQTFVREEWNQYFSGGRADAADGGWRGILYANLAIIDPKTAYNFFASSSFSPSYLDGGASRSWYLAWAAGLGGAQ